MNNNPWRSETSLNNMRKEAVTFALSMGDQITTGDLKKPIGKNYQYSGIIAERVERNNVAIVPSELFVQRLVRFMRCCNCNTKGFAYAMQCEAGLGYGCHFSSKMIKNWLLMYNCPCRATMQTLVSATGIPEAWWDGVDDGDPAVSYEFLRLVKEYNSAHKIVPKTTIVESRHKVIGKKYARINACGKLAVWCSNNGGKLVALKEIADGVKLSTQQVAVCIRRHDGMPGLFDKRGRNVYYVKPTVSSVLLRSI